jgi:hypothetical protein
LHLGLNRRCGPAPSHPHRPSIAASSNARVGRELAHFPPPHPHRVRVVTPTNGPALPATHHTRAPVPVSLSRGYTSSAHAHVVKSPTHGPLQSGPSPSFGSMLNTTIEKSQSYGPGLIQCPGLKVRYVPHNCTLWLFVGPQSLAFPLQLNASRSHYVSDIVFVEIRWLGC